MDRKEGVDLQIATGELGQKKRRGNTGIVRTPTLTPTQPPSSPT